MTPLHLISKHTCINIALYSFSEDKGKNIIPEIRNEGIFKLQLVEEEICI